LIITLEENDFPQKYISDTNENFLPDGTPPMFRERTARGR
jgi:hypothetical protein